MSRSMLLAELLPDLADIAADLSITGLVQDSRAVQPGNAFVAIGEFGPHGLRFTEQARAAGAAAILFEPPVPNDIARDVVDGLPAAGDAFAVPGLRARLGTMANAFHDAPSAAMTTVGVTGTNGKTSIVQLLAQAWTLLGTRSGTIGTLGAGLYGHAVPTGFTTPLVLQTHALLADLRDAGADAVAMEVSSHALAQGRVDAVAFEVAVFTNLTRDHLDYHGDMATYGAVKATLFSMAGLQSAVVNVDDTFGASLYAALAKATPSQLASNPGPALSPASGGEGATQAQKRGQLRVIGVSALGDASAAVRAGNVVLDAGGISFDLHVGDVVTPVRSPLLGRFNVDNLLTVAGVLHALGTSTIAIVSTLAQLQPVAGRMNRLGGDGEAPLVVIDYAHTPDALQQALTSLRAHVAGRLVCVFGCGGERDRGKRADMAAIAEAQADLVIVTDDNPRGEDGDAIVADVLQGFARRDAVVVQRDRAKAIARAIGEATAADIVLVAGKGHEPYQEIDGVRHDFDDTLVARDLLAARADGMTGQARP